jgi:hypothetical protein
MLIRGSACHRQTIKLCYDVLSSSSIEEHLTEYILVTYCKQYKLFAHWRVDVLSAFKYGLA